MADPGQGRYLLDPYLEWVKGEGIPIVEDFGIDLFTIETAPWPRLGVKGAAAHLKGRGDFTTMFVIEIAPGQSTSPQRHLYEEINFVLEGFGSTELEFSDGKKRSFEWGPRSLFAIPLNVKYRHFNGSGRERVRMSCTTNLPLVLNTFINPNFVFGCDFDFAERLGKADYFSGDGDLILIREGNHIWETNFVPDLLALELLPYTARGGDSTNVLMMLGDGVLHAHLSEMPVGTYKKAHRHPPGYHVMCLDGHGFSLLWYEGETDYLRIDWKYGVVFPPADKQFHQNFNTSPKPARYLATGVGSIRYPLTADVRALASPPEGGDKPADATSIKEGGNQIEYEDQDPRIHALWLEEIKKNGVTPRMEKFIS